MKRPLASLIALLALAVPARAHFLWLTAEKGDKAPKVEAFLNESPVPAPEFLGHIAKAKITAGDETLAWTKGEDAYVIELPGPTPNIVDGYCDLGVTKRGDATFRLLYTGRVQFAPANPGDPELKDHLRVRLVSREGKSPIAEVTFRGKPAAAAVVKAYPEDGKSIELKADAEGRVDMPGVAEGKTGLLAKWIEKGDGELDGKAYAETRHYATLTMAAGPAKAADDSAQTPKGGVTRVETPAAAAPFALLPEAVNSFGGAVSNGWLYVYSGHIGDTHKYSEATTTAHFRRLDLGDRTTWEDLPCGPPLQGVTLMAHGGMLYRIGGASAKNKPGTPDDLTSVADFARYDPQNKTWTDLPKLPSPRSTHDAVVAGDKIYVIGGWSMNGGAASNSEFCDDALVFDLAKKDATWERLPTPPFQRRALAVAENAGKVYVLGGLTDEGKVVKDVDVFDPASGAWSKGPEMPGSKLQGFAASAFGVGGRLYVSGQDGLLHRLGADEKTWEVAGKLAVPRLTHRLLPGISKDLLAVGGNFANSPTRVVESLPLNSNAKPKVIAWTAPVGTEARRGQSVALVRSKLLAVGGNRTADPHAFEPANLVGSAVEVNLGRVEAKAIDALPEPRQGGALVTVPARKTEAFLIGGIGPDGDEARTRGDVFRLDAPSGKWSKLHATVPDERGMFGSAVHKDAVYLFGGSIWDPRAGAPKRPMPVEILRWDPSSEGGTFEPIGKSLPRPRRSFAGAVLGSKYYMVGGLGEKTTMVEPVDVFDFETNTWGTIPEPSRPRLFAELVAMDGKLYLAGGVTKSEGGHSEPAPSIECFDPASGRWSTLLEQSPIDGAGVAALPIQGRILLYAPDRDGGRKARFAIVTP